MGYWSRRFQAACRDTAAVMNLKPLALAVTAIVSIGAVIVFGRIQGETAAQSQIDWIVSVVKVALGAGVIVFLINFFLITPWHMDQASQKTIAGLNEKIVELRGSEIVEAYAELSVQRTGEIESYGVNHLRQQTISWTSMRASDPRCGKNDHGAREKVS
jgi:hypothetical protein